MAEAQFGKPAQVSEEDAAAYARQQAIKASAFDLVGGIATGMVRFPKAMATQKIVDLGNDAKRIMTGKGFSTEAYKHIARVKVHFPDQQSFVDEIKGLNQGHAIARARSNWPGAVIEYLGPGTP